MAFKKSPKKDALILNDFLDLTGRPPYISLLLCRTDVRQRSEDADSDSEVTTEVTTTDNEGESDEDEDDFDFNVPMRFEQITREADVKTFTGLPSTKAFKCIFEYLLPRAQYMQYWRGPKQTGKEAPKAPVVGTKGRPGPGRKLDLQQEFLLTLMKLKLGLINEDLAFRFMVSSTTVSSVFITWVKLMSKELSVLIIWPSKQQVKSALPSCFKKLYPKVRCIIDCFECFTETPSGLSLAAALWSEYKHHYTCKVLVAITPTGAISYVSPSYGGRASDAHIVRNCGFLNLIEPYDEVMADRGFKIKEDLMMSMATLCIPPSCAASMQMLPSDVRKTSNIANVRIYVEQAIGRVKLFRILKHELPITLLPLVDDIVRVCCALCNLLPSLCE
ncbi:hypothetical protein AC249_AIPGENE26518 [Exaiptasia diaphana]|nr:hypothetical protein AC249_AIPGENE26518 [Exaiptasia diaphana]